MTTTPEDDDLLDAVGDAFSRLRRRTMQVPVDPPVSRTDLRRDLALTAIAEAGSQLSVSALAARLMIDQSGASRLTSELLNEGLIDRERSDSDGRSATLSVTAAGRDAMDRSRRQQRQAFEYITKDWTQHDRLEFARLLIRYAHDSSTAS